MGRQSCSSSHLPSEIVTGGVECVVSEQRGGVALRVFARQSVFVFEATTFGLKALSLMLLQRHDAM